MQWLSFTLEFIAVIIIVIYILNRFISWRSLPLFVYGSVLIGYLFSILMIFALPIDVAVVCNILSFEQIFVVIMPSIPSLEDKLIFFFFFHPAKKLI